MTQHHTGVGDGGFLAAQRVAGGAGIGAGTLGTHLEDTTAVDPADTAAAGTDGGNIDRGDTNGIAADGLLVGSLETAVHHQADISTGTADIHGDQVFFVNQIGDVLCAHNAGGRAGQSGLHGELHGLVDGHESAVGVIDVSAVDADGLQSLFQVVHVLLDFRANEGVQHRAAQTLILAELLGQVVGDGQESLGEVFLHDLLDADFVFGVQIGIEQHDGHGLGALFLQLRHNSLDLFRVDLTDHFTLIVQPLIHFVAEVAGHQRPGLVCLQVVQVGALLAADLQQVTETAGGDEGGLCAAAFQNRIGGNGSTVHKAADILTGEAISLSNDLHAFHHCRRLVVQRRGQLVNHQLAALFINGANVGIGTAHIHADSNGSSFHRKFLPYLPRTVYSCIMYTHL